MYTPVLNGNRRLGGTSLFNDFWDEFVSPGRSVSSLLRANIQETEASHLVELEVPGVDREHIDISVEGNKLCVRVNESKSEDGGGKYTLREIRSFVGKREFNLPRGIDPEGLDAELRDGILRISVPKPVEEQPRKIEIK